MFPVLRGTTFILIHIVAFDKGEHLHSAVAFENFGAFIDTDLAPPKNFSGAKLFRENDVIFIGHVLNLVLRLSLLCLLNEVAMGPVAMCFVSPRSPVSICFASWCASLFSLTFSSRLVCFLVEFWTLFPCLLCGLHEVYTHIMASPDLFIYLFIYLSTRVERLSRGLV